MVFLPPSKPKKVFLTIFVALLSTVSPYLSGVGVLGQDRSRADRVFPRLRLERPARGTAAIDAIGDRIGEVAVWYGKSLENLEGILRNDPDVWTDGSGRLYHVCEFGSVPGEAPDVSGVPLKSIAGPAPVDQTFALHSRPGSSKVIFLDFDGHETAGTLWNQLAGRETIITPPFDIDGNPTGFSPTELQRIQNIWLRVVEDFAPFDVDVTTEPPAPGALSKDSPTDAVFGTRIVIGGSSQDWYGQMAGGASYIGSFGWNSETPCFVFEEQLANGNEKYTAEAVSHETGHALGLFHDGQTNGAAYYAGHGSWAPIMGMSYNREITQWSKGDYSQANNTEDDLSIMQSNGLRFLGDDHGDQPGSATRLSGTELLAAGVIERSTDIDVFAFSTGAGTIRLNVSVANVSANLDVAASLLDASGRVISTSNSAMLGTSLSATVDAGTYYLRVEGVGLDDAVTGYTDYDSLGQYLLIGTVIASSSKPPMARASANPTMGNAPLAVAFSSSGSSDPDGAITDYQWTLGDGSTSTAPNPGYTYSREGTYTATLTVTDKDGLSARESVTIVVGPPLNQPPTAGALATPQRGVAPLNVRFSSGGSADVDGTIAAYQWSFGNGATSNEANPTLTYAVAGRYTALLTVTDNAGAQRSSSVVIEVNAPPIPGPVLYVADISVSLRPARLAGGSGKAAQSIVTIYDSEQGRHPRAVVTGTWSGVTSETVSGVTDAKGRVVFTSKSAQSNGSFVFVVTRVVAPGYTYDPIRNATTQESVSYQ